MATKVRSLVGFLTNRVFLPSWLLLVLFAFVFRFEEEQNQLIERQKLRTQVQADLSLIRSRVEGLINVDVQIVRSMVAALEHNPDMSQVAFGEIAERLIRGKSNIINVAAAPDLVVQMVHPYESNKMVLGLDYNNHPPQKAIVLQVKETGVGVLAGPVDLVQGGQGFIGRYPVYEGNGEEQRFWGILSIVFSARSLYDEVSRNAAAQDLRLSLIGRDGTGEGGGLFWGSPDVLEQDPVVTDIAFLEGRWQMAAVPVAGWDQPPENLWRHRLTIIAFGLGVLVPAFLASFLSFKRRKAIQELRQREIDLERKTRELEQLSLVAQSASDSILILDPSGKILWANAAFFEMSEFPREQVIGHNPSDFLIGEDTDPKTVELISEHVSAGAALRTEILNYTKTGRKIWVESRLVPIKSEDGSVSQVIAIERDITQSKAHAQELAEAKGVAERADRAKSEFLANMSHEIRTPMNGIMGMADLLATEELSETGREHLDLIKASSFALLKIINDILDLSRLEMGQFEISAVDFDLRECVDGAVALLRPSVLEKELTLSVNYAHNVPTLFRADDGRLRQIIVNLVGNAVKFTPSGAVSVDVDVSEDEPVTLTVSVTDTGIGLTPDEASRVFDRFAQADSATTRTFGGTGLGLTISRLLARQMGGDISVEASSGEGCRFTLTIVGSIPEHVVHIEPQEQPDDDRVLQGTKILLADDNRTNRLLIRRYLEGSGAALAEAKNGVEAVAYCERTTPDVILMDMSMPQMDGLEATRRIRSMPIHQPVIIALTANAFGSDREECLSVGMEGFMSKPIHKKTLVSVMARLVRARLDAEAALVKTAPPAAG